MPTRIRYCGMQSFASAFSTSTRVSRYLASTTDIRRKWTEAGNAVVKSEIIIEGNYPDAEINEENVQV